jgi:MoaA/NifB/PqqE/SkfB family radical SAM enzyme
VANLSISAACNQDCPYCFASDLRRQGREPGFTSLEEFERQLDFLDRSGIDQVRLLGGEPTLHPEFPRLVERARQRGKKILVFSNGLMPPAALECLAALPLEECTVLVNCNDPGPAGDPAHERRRAVLRRLGPRGKLGFTIYRPDFSLDFLRPLALESGSLPVIRLGLAHPTLEGGNRWLHPNQYPAAAARIGRFARQTAASSLRLELDCGFVRCMFAPADLEALSAVGTELGWHCSPILDIRPGGEAIHCYPLAGLGALRVEAHSDAPALRAQFEQVTRLYRQVGIYAECPACPFFRSGECPGGCLAAAMRRFRPARLNL